MAWLSGWKNRVKATISYANVPSAGVTWFPVLVHISSSCGINNDNISFIFSNVGSSYKKIAVTKDDGTTELYVEVESWDYTGDPFTSSAWIWVSKSGWSISGTVDTDIYLYYDITHADNSNVDLVNTTVGGYVWDSNFKAVWHLSESSGTLYDSTSNNNDLTAYNSPTYGYTGKIGKCMDFDGATQKLKRASAVVIGYPLTMEAWANLDAWTYLMSIQRSTTSYQAHATLGQSYASYLCSASGDVYANTSNTFSLGTWVYIVARGTSSTLREVYLNADVANKGTSTYNKQPSGMNLTTVGGLDGLWGDNSNLCDGRLDEVRISNSARSEGWIQSTYYTCKDSFLFWTPAPTSWVIIM